MANHPPPLTHLTQDTADPTQPSQLDPDDVEENNVQTTSRDFLIRLQYWLATLSLNDMYPVQLALVFRAGATINLHLLNKEKRKLLEMATKYKQLCDDGLRRNILSVVEHDYMKTLKHITSEKADTLIECPGWPSGKSLWDRYIKCRRVVRSTIGPLIPNDLQETPSGKGLKLAFEKVAFKLYKDVRVNPGIKKLSKADFDAMDDPHDAIKQSEIDKMKTKPFNLLLTARIFFDSPILKADIKQVQDTKVIPSRHQLRKEANMKRAENSKTLQDMAAAEAAAEKKRRLNNERRNQKTSASRANSMAEIARNESIKSFFSISQAIYSPDTLKEKMEPALKSMQRYIAQPAAMIDLDEVDDDMHSVVEVTATGSKSTSGSSVTSPTVVTGNKDGKANDGTDDSVASSTQ